MTEKWIIENGEIKDTTTNMTFDSFVEIITVLNGQSRRITELASDNKRLKFQLNDCLNKKLFSRRELEKENTELKQFKDKTIHMLNEKIEQYKNIEPRERSINDAVFILDELEKELKE